MSAASDGTALTPTYSSDSVGPAITGNLFIGTSFGGQNLNARVAYVMLLQDPTTDDIDRLEGWAAWKFNLKSKLPSGHTYKNIAPTV